MICFTVGFGGPGGSAAASSPSGFFPPVFEEPPAPVFLLDFVSFVELVNTMKSSFGCEVAVFLVALEALDEEDFFDDELAAAAAAGGAADAFSLPFFAMLISHLAS